MDPVSTCIFCAIVAGTAPASHVYGDDRVVAFLDIAPATPGHLLVVPRRHAPHLADLHPGDGARMFSVAQRLAAALRRSRVPAEGVNLLLADGVAAGQEVFHAHLHVLPRSTDDGVVLDARFGSPDRAHLDRQADHLRAVLDGHEGRS